MPREIDEDLIEATIRRVAEAAKASRDAAPEPSPDEESRPVPNVLRTHDEDGNEIDRITTAQQEPPSIPVEPMASEESAEAEEARTLEKLRFDDDGGSGPRRFAALAAGGNTRALWPPIQDGTEPDEEPASDGVESEDDLIAPSLAEPAPLAGEWAQEELDGRKPAESAGPTLAQIAGAIEEINDRLDGIIDMLTKMMPGRAPMPSGDWAGNARVTPMAAGRVALRDPRAATAEALAVDAIDTRPLPPPQPPLHVDPPKRGLELLPRTYRITVEDKRRGVDLVPLHRALLGMDGVKDMSLLSYNNGVAIVALETTGEVDPDVLGASVSRAMARDAKVEVHNESTMVVKLAEE